MRKDPLEPIDQSTRLADNLLRSLLTFPSAFSPQHAQGPAGPHRLQLQHVVHIFRMATPPLVFICSMRKDPLDPIDGGTKVRIALRRLLDPQAVKVGLIWVVRLA